MICIQNLFMEFEKGSTVLDNISLEIKDGEFLALLGPSGCGKSTTLNCIAGLLTPISGKILIDGKDITKETPQDRNIGMCFQSYALYPHMTVLDNIAFPLKMQGINKSERYKRAKEIARNLRIEQLLNRLPRQLSGGQQQRVAMCRALVRHPKVLLLDEPMSNLDARLKVEVREDLKELQHKLHISCIIVTHDQEEAMALADRVAVLSAGKVQQFDTPYNLYAKPINHFVADFMGNPPMNFIEAEINTLNGSPILNVGGFAVRLRKEMAACLASHLHEKVEIGIRPHQLHICQSNENAIPIQMSQIENLGKEVLVSGIFCGKRIRLTTQDLDTIHFLYKKSKEHNSTLWVNFGEHFNIFGGKNQINLIPQAN